MTDELMALLPCPFCGGEAEVIWYDGFPCIRCKTYDCGCGTGMHSSGGEAKAIAAWNRRTELPALIAERDALREALRPFAKSGDLLVRAEDAGDFWAYRPAGGDEYGISGKDLLAARAALGASHDAK